MDQPGPAGRLGDHQSPTIGRQLLARGLLDEMDLHVLLGDGVRLYDDPGGSPVPLQLLNGDQIEEVDLRYRPVARSAA